MPSPESPAKRMTARSMTSRLCFTGGVSIKVDIVARAPLFPNSHTNFPEGVWLNLLDGQYENQVGFSIQPPGADRRRIPYRHTHGRKRDLGRQMCRYRKDSESRELCGQVRSLTLWPPKRPRESERGNRARAQ